MNYVLVYMLLAAPMQTGPFNNVHGCHQALSQIQTLHPKTRGVCIDLNAKPQNWNGKEIKK